MMPARRFAFVLLVVSLAVAPVGATTIVVPTDDQLIAKSPAIAIGTVLTTAAVEDRSGVWTDTELRIEETLKGPAADRLTIRESGGVIGSRASVVFGSPRYVPGERVLVFLWPRGDGRWQTRDLFIGKFTERRTISGRTVWYRDPADPATTLLDRTLQRHAPEEWLRDAAAFTAHVRGAIHGHGAPGAYVVPGEPLVGVPTLEPKFALIDAPPLYRWFAFDDGDSVTWHRVGTQPGYDGDGDREVTLGLVAWTRPGTNAIRFAYAGASNQPGGGLNAANGRNEIILDDALREIDGSWTRGGSGVVGRGGFSAARLHGDWDAPFDAGGDLHGGRWNGAWVILEGNLVIQDGVSPAAGISSGVLAEIIAHEFGHTLGFGHSGDRGSLMYPTITAAGAHLREDDELAARWLYPRPPGDRPPSAPAALRAVSSAEGVTLSWVDSAHDETGFVVYVAEAGNSFTRAMQLPADSSMARLQGLLAATSYHTYVVAVNAAGESSPSNVVPFTSPDPQPLFFVSPESGKAGATLFVCEDITPNGLSRVWQFGDGSTATDPVVTHVYKESGTFEITLRVTMLSGIETVGRRVVSVVAADNPLQPSFLVTPSSPTAGESVRFRDASTGPITSRIWHFGDGSTASDAEVTRTYADPGTYRVVLTISDGERIATTARDLVVAAPRPFRSVIPVVASTGGLGGSLWMTEAVIHNHGDEAASVRITLIPATGGEMRTASVTIAPAATVVYDNVFEDVFSTAAGAGAVLVEATGATRTPLLKVTSRTYSTSSQGSLNQVVPDSTPVLTGTPRYIAGVALSASFRTNLGFVNLESSEQRVTLTLFDPAGTALETATFALMPLSFRQIASSAVFPAWSDTRASASHTIEVEAGPHVHAYASVVDNQSHDAVFIPATAPPLRSESWIPVVASTRGATGALWQSDLTLFNPSGEATTVDLAYVGGPDDAAVLPLVLAPRTTFAIADLLQHLGYASARGAMRLSTSPGAPHPIARSRAYTVRSGETGTVGQSIDAASGESFGSSFVIAGVPHGNGWRVNVGLVNRAAAERDVVLMLSDTNGWLVAQETVRLRSASHWQMPLTAIVSDLPPGRYTITVTAEAGDVFAYGSCVDNASGDPVYLPGE